MNYIAIQYFEWLVRVDHYQEGVILFGGKTPVWSFVNYLGIKDPLQPFPKTPIMVEATFLPSIKSILESNLFVSLFGGAEWFQALLNTPAFSRITLAPILGILAVIIMVFIMFKTVIGYRSRAVGISQEAARFMGINVKSTLFTTALISGVLAGLAGGMEVLGTQHRMIPNFLVNAGFDGIPVALIGQLHPVGAFLSATFFGALRAGANKMQIITSVPIAVVYIIQSLAIVFAIAGTTIDIGSTLKKKRIARESDVKKKIKAAEGEVNNAS
jgi:ABC-type uncharacterized transport system permease subunit